MPDIEGLKWNKPKVRFDRSKLKITMKEEYSSLLIKAMRYSQPPLAGAQVHWNDTVPGRCVSKGAPETVIVPLMCRDGISLVPGLS